MRCITAGKSTRDIARGSRAVVLGIAHLGVQAGSADERFRRHAADIQAVAAEQLALDERDLGAQRRRGVRRDQSRRAAADDHQVVARRGLRIAPVARADVFQPRLVHRIAQGAGVAAGRHVDGSGA